MEGGSEYPQAVRANVHGHSTHAVLLSHFYICVCLYIYILFMYLFIDMYMCLYTHVVCIYRYAEHVCVCVCMCIHAFRYETFHFLSFTSCFHK